MSVVLAAARPPAPNRHQWFEPGTHITVRGLRKRFGATALYDGFDLDIPRGKIVSIFGPNGCGKSSLINMMAGIMPRDATGQRRSRCACRTAEPAAASANAAATGTNTSTAWCRP